MPETDEASEACSQQLVLASPWRRLAASATDALILLVLNLCAVGVRLLLHSPTDHGPLNWAAGALIVGWVYTWIGWGLFGTTVGKRLWGICIVPAAGGRMTLARGALRCVGYVVACLPARLGLAAILWDPNRQGWHDRIAGTLVVVDTGPGPTPPLPRPTAPPLPAPDLLGPLRRGALPALLYVALALFMTFPVVTHLNTRRAGIEGDGNVFVWNLWLFDHALRSSRPLTSTDFAYYPETVSLVYHTMDWVACAAAVPLLRVLSLTATYNVIVLLTLASGAFAMYWLAAAVTRCYWSSVVGGFAFGFSCYVMAHALGHLNLISVQFLPVTCLLFYSALVTGKPTHALAAGVALALCGLCDWYYLVFGVVAIVCLAAVVLLTQGAPRLGSVLRVGALGCLAGGTAALLVLPLLIRARQERAKGSYMNVRQGVAARFSADPADFVRPSELHPLRRPLAAAPELERHVTPGLIILALSVVGLWRQRRMLTPWVALALCGMVLACGPRLRAQGGHGPNALASILLGGPPGTGLDPPISGTFVSGYCLSFAGDPVRALAHTGPAITMPFYWLSRSVPLLRPCKAPARLALLASLGLALCASVGLSSLYEMLAARGRGTAFAGIALVCAAILFENLVVPYPTMPTRVHGFYPSLAQDPADFAIVEAPMHECLSQYQAYQAVHHKRLFQVNLARMPTEALAFIRTNRLLQCLAGSPERPMDPLLSLPALRESPGPLATPEGRASVAEALRQLRRIDARYIVVHKAFLRPESLRLCHQFLAEGLGLRIVVDDDEITVFALT